MKKNKIYNVLCAECDYEELIKIRAFIFDNAQKFGFDEFEAQNIALAVDEACSNLIRHAYNFQKDKEIFIEIESNGKYLVVKIMDDGSPFDPMSVEQPDMETYFNQYQKGGLGIQIMRKIMDKIEYIPSNSKQTQNILRLKKLLHS